MGRPIGFRPACAPRCEAPKRPASRVRAAAPALDAPAGAAPAASEANGDAAAAAAAGRLVRFGFPKGSLQKSTENLFQRAGFELKISERGYFPRIDDEELQMVLFRSQEISRYVEDGVLDAGICGYDWVVENGADVVEVCELPYSKATSNPARWVLAVPEDSRVQGPEDLAGTIVASELVNTTKKFFADRNIAVKKVEYSWGATEVKASLPGVGGIVDITETGSSLKANNLRVVATILASTTRLVANRAAWADPAKRSKIEDVALLLLGAIEGRNKVGLKMNLPRSSLEEVSACLPSERSPTVSQLVDSDYVAIEVVLGERQAPAHGHSLWALDARPPRPRITRAALRAAPRCPARDIIPICKRLGATGILSYPINVIVH
ncbi:ATP phosphoribosyltransferase [Monoraphidium neglectum]|uniref:ATP phosphoribosyltransferase n=1 Tax=Monoraphidium neglectum TaxID=145388 RepID=A0A0D2LCW4_9CHLO|nr:ATP phosphoribosyltransferase [Monoraphidium neglectum]KIZ04569.1 ATP phosphoribosyltransferase [Monoraphidium neglectum]|eukprot:XP_013903588.1 ATP phosphoribosyltransferase [Monoraphidium neglectum]